MEVSMKIMLSKLFLFYCPEYHRTFAFLHSLLFLAPIAQLFILGELVRWNALFFATINLILFFLIRPMPI